MYIQLVKRKEKDNYWQKDQIRTWKQFYYIFMLYRYIYIYIHALDILGKFRCLDIIQAYGSTVTYFLHLGMNFFF